MANLPGKECDIFNLYLDRRSTQELENDLCALMRTLATTATPQELLTNWYFNAAFKLCSLFATRIQSEVDKATAANTKLLTSSSRIVSISAIGLNMLMFQILRISITHSSKRETWDEMRRSLYVAAPDTKREIMFYNDMQIAVDRMINAFKAFAPNALN